MDCEPRYSIRFFDRSGLSLDGPKNIEMLHWQRKLDDVSTSDFDIVISGDDCCGQLGRIEPIAHMLEIRRNADLVWYGWVLDTERSRKQFHFSAFDAIGWLKRRRVHSDMSWTDVDVAEIFVDLWNDATLPDPVKAQVVKIATGTFETRSVRKSENRLSWSVIKEMLDSGLDITTFGQTILAGVIHTTKSIELKLSDFEGDIRLAKLGSQYANLISVDASEQIQAHYPQEEPKPNEHYPLVEMIVKDAQIEDVGSAFNLAKARYESSRFVPRVLTNTESLVLNPNVNVDINDLIPGIRVIVDTEGLCSTLRQEFRLQQVDVNMAGGAEKITLSLGPTGPRDNLDSSEDPIL